MSRGHFHPYTAASACCGDTCCLGTANRGSLVLHLMPQLLAAHEDLGTAHLKFQIQGCLASMGNPGSFESRTALAHIGSKDSILHSGSAIPGANKHLGKLQNSMVPSCYRPTLPEGHKHLGTAYVQRLQHSTDCCVLFRFAWCGTMRHNDNS